MPVLSARPLAIRAAALAAVVLPLAAAAQPRPAPRPAAAAAPGGPVTYDSLAFAALRWREIGPFRGGRSVAVSGSAARPQEYWMGSTGAGVYKSVDGGQTWVPMTDQYFGGTIGAVAVAPSNPDVVYVGTGEYPIRGNVSHGEGVWKTTDAGKTWTFLGLKDTRQISRVRVHPTNPQVAWVAAQGNVWLPTKERGVYKTTDGGRTWKQVLFRHDSAGASDLALDPSNPDVLYAAFWQAGRLPWQLISGGTHSGIFKSTDGGESWKEITRNPGLPQAGPIGNIGLTVSAARPSRVWAIVEHDSGGVFRSDDGGATWTKTNSERKLRQRAWYYSKIHADPKDTNVVYVNNVSFHKSTDGGKTFRAIRAPHGDSHDLWIAPDDPQRMIEANDGGANVSTTGGRAWTDQDYATAQFYHVTTTNHFPYRVCGAQQDNSTLCGPSRNQGGITMADWYDAGGGESGYIAVRPDKPDVIFAGSYGGYLTRKDAQTGIERDVNPWPLNPMGHSAEDLVYRFQWTFPIVISAHDPNTLYVASNVLFRSRDEGESFERISPDLTRHDPRTLGASGGPITKDQTSVEYFGTIFAVAESPLARGTIWTGSDDGVVHLTRDGGATWSNVTPPQLGEFTRVSIIEASRHAAGTAYLAANRFQLGDMRPYLWKTTDYGGTWTPIVTGIAADEFTRVIREDPERRGLLYAGTERGVWVSFDDGQRWQRLQRGRSGDGAGALPPVPVHDLAVKEGDLVAGTHGRSFWILDDLSALRQLTPAVVRKTAHLFTPRDAYRVQWGGGNATGAKPTGVNPASGAVIQYWLAQPNRTVTLEFLDAAGKAIRTFTSAQDSTARADSIARAERFAPRRDSLARAGVGADSLAKLEMAGEGRGEGAGGEEEEEGPRRAPRPARVANKAGLNTFAWNLRYPDASTFENMILWAGGTQGPVAPPGTYAVRLAVDGQPVGTAPFRVLKDPRSTATAADLAAQFAMLLQIRDATSRANDAVKTVRNVRAQLDDRVAKMPAGERAAFEAQRTALLQPLTAIEGELYQVRNQSGQDPLNYPIRLNNKIAALSGVVGSAEARPTRQARVVLDTLTRALDAHLTAMKSAMDRQLPPVNATLKRLGLAEIVPAAVEPRAARRPLAADDEEAMEERKRW